MTKTIKTVSFAAAAILVVIICTFLIIRQTHENVLSKETVVKKVEASYEGKVLYHMFFYPLIVLLS